MDTWQITALRKELSFTRAGKSDGDVKLILQMQNVSAEKKRANDLLCPLGVQEEATRLIGSTYTEERKLGSVGAPVLTETLSLDRGRDEDLGMQSLSGWRAVSGGHVATPQVPQQVWGHSNPGSLQQICPNCITGDNLNT